MDKWIYIEDPDNDTKTAIAVPAIAAVRISSTGPEGPAMTIHLRTSTEYVRVRGEQQINNVSQQLRKVGCTFDESSAPPPRRRNRSSGTKNPAPPRKR